MSILTAKVAGVPRVVGCAPPYGGDGIYPEVLLVDAPGRRRRDLGGRRRAGARHARLRRRGAGAGRPDRRARQHVRGRGQAAALRHGRHRPAGRPDRDPRSSPTRRPTPCVVAADLLGQAEHGPTSPAVLVSTSRALGHRRARRGRPPAAAAAVRRGHPHVVGRDSARSSSSATATRPSRLADRYAPEHLEVQTADPDWYGDRLRNYGTLCLGEEATIAFSDKAIGTNHTLPTGRGRPLHRRPLGRQVPQDGDLPALHARGRPRHRAARGAAQRRRALARPRRGRPACARTSTGADPRVAASARPACAALGGDGPLRAGTRPSRRRYVAAPGCLLDRHLVAPSEVPSKAPPADDIPPPLQFDRSRCGMTGQGRHRLTLTLHFG